MKRLMVALMLMVGTVPLYADSAVEVSHAFNKQIESLVLERLNTLPKHASIKLFLKDGTEIVGKFDSYHKYDQSVWVDVGNLFDNAYDLSEVVAVERVNSIDKEYVL